MSQYLVLNKTDYAALSAKLDSAFGYPTEDGQTLTYAPPLDHALQHPVSGLYAMPIQDRCLEFLSEAQALALVSSDEMHRQGWFPGPGNRMEFVPPPYIPVVPKVSHYKWAAAMGAASAAALAVASYLHFVKHLF